MFNFSNTLALLIFLSISTSTYCQIGINTTAPQSLVDITASDTSNPTNKDGILIPRVEKFPSIDPESHQDGMMVFLTQNIPGYFRGFHYWDHTLSTPKWIPLVLEEWKPGVNTAGDPLIFATRAKNSGTDMVITDDGRIGFGTSDPVERFEFRGPGDNDFQITSANTNPPNFILYNTGGTLDLPTALAPNGEIGSFIVKTHDGSNIRENGGFRFYMDGVATPGSVPSRFVINTTPQGSTLQQQRISVRSNGNVGLSEPDPTARLDVNGTMRVRSLEAGAVYSDNDGNISIGPTIAAAGKIAANGIATKINGATVLKSTTGVYNIVFTKPLDDANYIIQLTVKRCASCGLTDDSLTAYYTNQTTAGFSVNVGYNDNGTTALGLSDYEFMFTVITI